MGTHRPLDGVTVVDFTRHMAGPYATVTLSDFGADVIKVESYPDGDPSRHAGAHFINGEAAPFLVWNRGKRSVCINMRTPEGLGIVQDLIAESDVVVENYRPGVAEEIGIGYETLKERNPRLIYCSISAFGQEEPLRNYPGTDPIVQALSGVMSLTGEPDGRPVMAGVPIGDFTGAMLGVQGIILALYERERTGQGQRVDVSLLYGLMSAWTTRVASYWATGENPPRFGGEHSVLVPFSIFKAADGYMMAGSWGGDSWPKFCAAADLPDLAARPEFGTGDLRAQNRDELLRLLREQFSTRTVGEWEARFQEHGALFAPVLQISQVLSHPQVEAAGLLEELDHPTAGKVPHLGPPIRLSETPGYLERPAPLLGQHTAEVLESLGVSQEQIDAYASAGLLTCSEAASATG